MSFNAVGKHCIILMSGGKIALTETKALPAGTLTVKYNNKPGFNVATSEAYGTATERIVTMNIPSG